MDIIRICLGRLLAVLGVLFWPYAGVLADTTFVAGDNVEGTWTATGSPYVVTGNLTVLAGDSLEIGSGTRVYFAGAFGMSVQGYLGADGTEGDSVVFTTDTLLNPGKWRGLSFPNAHDSSFIRYALFENAYSIGPLNADSLGGAIYCSAGTVLRIEHSSFRYNYSGLAGGAVYYTSATCWMDSCNFYRNSTGRDGGGLFLNNTFGSVVTNVHLRANSALNNGGGIYTRGTTPVISRCVLDSNFAQINGGGISFKNSFAHLDSSTLIANSGGSHGGGMSFEQSYVEVFDCVIQANYTLNFDGGGAYIWESSPHFLRCQVLYNVSADDGGGIHTYRSTSDGLFEQCEVRGNAAAGEGAGIWVTLDGSPVFSECIVRQNNAGTYGGGVFVRYGALPTFIDCEIDSNMAGLQGGGLSILQSIPTIVDCKIRHNTATAEGGGLNLWEAADATLERCEITGNSAGLSGGGVSVNQSDLRAENCLITGNSSATAGGGVATTNAGGIDFEHCTIAGNAGGELRIESSSVDVENCILGAVAGGDALYLGAVPTARITYSTLHGTIAFEGNDPASGPPWIGVLTAVNGNGDSCDTYFNVLSDPQFVDTASGDWTLFAGSSSIGAGNWNELPTDISGNSRPQPAGTLPDMGAYESASGLAPTGLFGLLGGALGPGEIKVVADVRIDTTATLTVAPGTTVLFCGPSSLQLRGNLQAVGVVTDSIRFVTDTLTNPGRWRGIEGECQRVAE
ncbi:MAG: hypothetical protein IPG71_13400 [bacterium]|nr:hypothetical protein [bacterium]